MLQRLVRTFRDAYGGVPTRVWLISLVLLVARCGTMVLPFLSLYFANELGFRPAQIGWLLGVYGIGGILAGLLGGLLTQRIGAVPTMVLSLVFSIPGFLILGWVRSYQGAALSLLYLSVVSESIRPASVTATVEFCDDETQHTKALAVNRLAVNLGMTVGPTIGGFLAAVDFQWLFYGNAIGFFLALLFLLRAFGWSPHQAIASEKKSTKPSRSPFQDSEFMIFAFLTVMGAMVFFQLMSTFPLYLEEYYQLQEYHIGLLFAINTIVIVAFELLLVNYVSRFDTLRVVAWGQLLSCIGFGLLPLAVGSSFSIGFAFCALTVLIWTFGEMLAMPMGAAYVARRSDSTNRGKYMGLFVAAFSIAAVIGPVAGMWIYQWNPHALWFLALMLGSAVFLGFLHLGDRQSAGQSPSVGESLPD